MQFVVADGLARYSGEREIGRIIIFFLYSTIQSNAIFQRIERLDAL